MDKELNSTYGARRLHLAVVPLRLWSGSRHFLHGENVS
jgi:hypothetical protein